jgi:hypothetical protein
MHNIHSGYSLTCKMPQIALSVSLLSQGCFKILATVGPAHERRQQRNDVVHHRLHPRADRLKAGQPNPVEHCGSQYRHEAGAIASAGLIQSISMGWALAGALPSPAAP